ncbi:80_t:CDS:2 [Entrophospora sp. SA101]|nr:80_t:CDS:2 [Entrophospora sp. SA101]
MTSRIFPLYLRDHSRKLGGKPNHVVFHEFVYTEKNIKVNQSNSFAIYKGCTTRKGFSNAKTEAQNLGISNTVKSIEKHLLDCEIQKTCYPDKIEFVDNYLEIIKQKESQNRSIKLLENLLFYNICTYLFIACFYIDIEYFLL